MADLKKYIRSIPDFPKKGIMFRDITTLLKDPIAFQRSVEALRDMYRSTRIDKIVAIESRGFILGAALAYTLGTGFVPVRKQGKLPSLTLSESYDLEYGSETIEIHRDAVEPGERVLIHDDLLATGGTALATCRLLDSMDAVIVGVNFLIELTFLEGRKKFKKYPVTSLIAFDDEKEYDTPFAV